MERGPLALFGAIVAVGLGPALWLGVQFGRVEVAPIDDRAPVTVQTPGSTELLGGTGGGDETSTPDNQVIKSTPRGEAEPTTRTPVRKKSPSPKPSESSQSPSPDPATVSPDPEPSVSEPSDDPSEPPPGGDESEDPSLPPEPPVSSGPPGEDDGPGNQLAYGTAR